MCEAGEKSGMPHAWKYSRPGSWSSEQPGLMERVSLSTRLDWDDPEGPFQPETILEFCQNFLTASKYQFLRSPEQSSALFCSSAVCDLSLVHLAAANTSCGLPLKMLRKTPIYTCGTYLVMLVPPPGGSGSSATRSLFGGTSALSSLKSKSEPFVADWESLAVWNAINFSGIDWSCVSV